LDSVRLAEQFCKKAHKGQLDKGGHEYYLHPFAVAEICKTDEEKTVALLHDVIEDTDTTADDLLNAGFSDTVVNAVLTLTHRPDESYDDYIKRVKQNPLAKAVKLNDLRHNSDLSRLKTVNEQDIRRAEKYKMYIEYLKAPDE